MMSSNAIRIVRLRVAGGDCGKRVDDFLADQIGGLSRIRLGAIIARACCRVNDVVARAGQRLGEGDLLEVLIEDTGPSAMTAESIPLELVYEDEHLVVVVKPAGMLSHPSKHVKTGTLANALAYHLNRGAVGFGQLTGQVVRPGLVHRLDRDTSGLMVVARTPRALAVLSSHFRRRLVEKRYLALVRGEVKDDSGVIIAPIGRRDDRTPHWGVSEEGRYSETRFAVARRLSGCTLLDLEPVTGRTNQLRVHCAHAGHPIVGDFAYGGADGEEPPARLCLHASRLGFHHPVGGRWMEFESQPPADMKAIVERFG